MRAFLRHKLLIVATAVAVAALAGGAYAATQTGGTSRQAFLNDVAKRLNVSPSQLNSALRGALIDRLNAAVKAGMLTQAQAKMLEQRIQQGAPLPFFGPPGLAPRAQALHGFMVPFGPRTVRGGLGTASTYLGLSTTQLLKDLSSGKSLAQIATSRGKSVTGLENALSAELKSSLDRALAADRITKAQEQRLLNRLSSRISRLVNRAPGRPALRFVPFGPANGYGPPPPTFGAAPPAGNFAPGQIPPAA